MQGAPIVSSEAAAAPAGEVLLAVEGVTKHFAGVTALNDVSLDVRRGEILGLLGENGAGKSTLLKILSGVQPPSSGRIVFDGVEFKPSSPQESKRAGIVTIYQELSLIPTLTVAENIFIGRAPVGPLGLVELAEDGRRLAPDHRPRRPDHRSTHAGLGAVGRRAAARRDRPGAVAGKPPDHHGRADLGADGIGGAAAALDHGQAAQGWRGDHVRDASAGGGLDHLRPHDGAARRPARRASRPRQRPPIQIPKIIEKMVGRAASELYARPHEREVSGEVSLSVRGLRTVRDPEAPHAIVLEGVDLDLKAGEILGVAGLVGSGRTELARAIFGADRIAAGTITLEGKPIAPASPADAIALGIGLVPEDRKHQAIFAALGILTNFSVAALGRFSNGFGFMAERRERESLSEYKKMLSIRMASPEQAMEGLSGGNQQKVVLARWLARDPKVLIVDEPTRGVDVGAKAEVHQILVQLARRGIAIMMISSELPEVLAVSDRIVTMRRGRITGEMPAIEATEEKLMELMALDRRQGRAQ